MSVVSSPRAHDNAKAVPGPEYNKPAEAFPETKKRV